MGRFKAKYLVQVIVSRIEHATIRIHRQGNDATVGVYGADMVYSDYWRSSRDQVVDPDDIVGCACHVDLIA